MSKLLSDGDIIRIIRSVPNMRTAIVDVEAFTVARAIEQAVIERCAVVCRKSMDSGDLYPEEAIRAMAKGN